MAQTSRWLSLADASSRLDIPEYQALALAVSGRIKSRLTHDHRELCAVDLDEFASELAAREGEDLAESKPTVRGGPVLPLDIEDEFQRRKDDA
ncbi:hypothetical protein [Nonomuraea sp. NPDC049028]|uniref:hypothetical protein n=1 Tax=Nonomuraea sp. NPDC049028 TaxID=3364348 RepID=UPI003713DE8D